MLILVVDRSDALVGISASVGNQLALSLFFFGLGGFGAGLATVLPAFELPGGSILTFLRNLAGIAS